MSTGHVIKFLNRNESPDETETQDLLLLRAWPYLRAHPFVFTHGRYPHRKVRTCQTKEVLLAACTDAPIGSAPRGYALNVRFKSPRWSCVWRPGK